MNLRAALRGIVRRGPRDILRESNRLRGGNHLYLWMLASNMRAHNPLTFVEESDNQAVWFTEFPALIKLNGGRVRITDRRHLRLGQGFDSDFTREELISFCSSHLLSSPSFRCRLSRARDALLPGTLTVNVRRGDYYGTRHEPEFGMRIVPYVEHAVGIHANRGEVSRVQLVSDDLSWCENHLTSPLRALGVTETSFSRLGTSMMDDLATLAASRRLVLANSTFSYWGAYLATVLGTTTSDVVAPAFHQKAFGDATPWFHDPQWSLVRSLPGGWQAPSAQAHPAS